MPGRIDTVMRSSLEATQSEVSAPGAGAPPRPRRTWVRSLAESIALAVVFALGFRFPAASGHGYLEAVASFAFPTLLLWRAFGGRALGWSYLTLWLGMAAIFSWVPETLETKGNLPRGAAYLGACLFYAYEAFGFFLVVWIARLLLRRAGIAASSLGAALGVLLFELHAFHIYPCSFGAALGGLPVPARGAAFLGTYGLSALIFGTASATAGLLLRRGWRLALLAPACALALLLALGAAWHWLPREPERVLDIVIVQPNYPPGVRRAGMEADMWRRTDPVLREKGLPRSGVTTLLLWPESAVLGQRHELPDSHVVAEAKRRGVAWLFGTEGRLLNLVRGEVDDRPSFIQAKVEPMAFGERMPGPRVVRLWLDDTLGFISQEPGTLTAHSSFAIPTPQGELLVHPLICSEALLPLRARDGLALAGGEILSNHTNDGWFGTSIATDLHAAQIRLRAVELGVPLVRATLTGKSGLFRADGTWELWGEPLTEATYAFELRWQPVHTPARSAWVLRAMLAGLALALLARRPWRRSAS
jgi:apolipoprotein N-acyltransferase